MGKHNVKYAYYKGDTLKAIGTLKELAQKLGVSVSTIASYKSPSRMARVDGGNKSSLFKLADPPPKVKPQKEKDKYNVYKGDKLIASGTIAELRKELDLCYSTLMKYKSPSFKKANYTNRIRLEKI